MYFDDFDLMMAGMRIMEQELLNKALASPNTRVYLNGELISPKEEEKEAKEKEIKEKGAEEKIKEKEPKQPERKPLDSYDCIPEYDNPNPYLYNEFDLPVEDVPCGCDEIEFPLETENKTFYATFGDMRVPVKFILKENKEEERKRLALLEKENEKLKKENLRIKKELEEERKRAKREK